MVQNKKIGRYSYMKEQKIRVFIETLNKKAKNKEYRLCYRNSLSIQNGFTITNAYTNETIRLNKDLELTYIKNKIKQLIN